MEGEDACAIPASASRPRARSEDAEAQSSSSARHPLRIAYLFMSYPMASQPFAISDVKALEAKGHRVDIYALRRPGRDHAELLQAYGLTLHAAAHPSVATWRVLASRRGLAMAGFLLRIALRHLALKPVALAKTLALSPRMVEITEILRTDPPDVLHAFWGHYPSLVLLLAERFAPSVHRSLFLGAYDLTTHLVSFAPRAAANADSVWTHAAANRPLLQALDVPMTKVTVVERGIPLDLADGVQIPKVPDRICTAANFQKEKNIDLIIESFAHLAPRRPQATLLLAGDGAERKRLEALVDRRGLRNRVVFTGFLTRAALFREMQRSALFVFMSTKASERLPNVVKEAMLAKTLCLVSRTADIEQLVIPGRTGEIVDHLDAETIAARMLALLDEPDGAAIAERAAAHVSRSFSAAATMERYVAGWRHARGVG